MLLRISHLGRAVELVVRGFWASSVKATHWRKARKARLGGIWVESSWLKIKTTKTHTKKLLANDDLTSISKFIVALCFTQRGRAELPMPSLHDEFNEKPYGCSMYQV